MDHVDSDLVRVIKEAEQSIEHDYCVTCRISGVPQTSIGIQKHHIAGKVLGKLNFRDVIAVCDRCHEYLSDHQRAWLLCRRDNVTRLSSYFFGWADIFDLISNKSGSVYFERLASKFRSQGWHIRNNRKAKPGARLEKMITA